MTIRIKNQHYVPRFLLNEFCIHDNTGHSHVWCFDKRDGKTFRAAVENICAERSFYDLDSDQGAEFAFAEMEGKLRQCHRAVLEARDISLLSTHERAGIAVLIALQQMRTRAFRNTINEALEMASAAVKAVNPEGEVNSSILPSMDFSEEDPAKLLQLGLIDRAIPEFAKSLLQMKWILLVNQTELPFWCSDNPFTSFNPYPHDEHDGRGFERMGSQTQFPFSSNIALSIVDPRCYSQYPAVIPLDDPQFVVFNNHLQVKNAERFVFSSSNDFELAKQMVAEKPSLKNPSQSRFKHLAPNRLRS